MKIKIPCLLIIMSIMCALSTPSYAERAFDGYNVQLGLGKSHAKSPISTSYSDDLKKEVVIHETECTGDITFWGWHWCYRTGVVKTIETTYINADDSFTISKSNTTGNIAAGYSRSTQDYNMALNVFYNIGSQNYGSEQLDKLSEYAQDNVDISSGAIVEGTGDVYGRVKIKQIIGLTLEPGYYAQDNILAYVKVGPAWTKSELQINGGFDDGALDTTVKFGSTFGLLYGIGVKYALSENWYLGAEAYQVKFESKTTTTPFFGKHIDDNSSNYYTGAVNPNTATTPYNEDTTSTYKIKPTYSYAGLVVGYKF